MRFHFPPQKPEWGGIFTRFEDVDGNSFGLAGFDELTLSVESQRRAIAQKLESERRAARELEIARQVQARLFPQRMPPARTLEYTGACLQARQVGETTTISWTSARTGWAASLAISQARESQELC